MSRRNWYLLTNSIVFVWIVLTVAALGSGALAVRHLVSGGGVLSGALVMPVLVMLLAAASVAALAESLVVSWNDGVRVFDDRLEVRLRGVETVVHLDEAWIDYRVVGEPDDDAPAWSLVLMHGECQVLEISILTQMSRMDELVAFLDERGVPVSDDARELWDRHVRLERPW